MGSSCRPCIHPAGCLLLEKGLAQSCHERTRSCPLWLSLFPGKIYSSLGNQSFLSWHHLRRASLKGYSRVGKNEHFSAVGLALSSVQLSDCSRVQFSSVGRGSNSAT